MFVAIILGSKSDYEIMKECAAALERLGVKHELIVASAHRSPNRVIEYVQDAEKRGAAAFIAAAGLAAHLAGSIAARTVKAVIGVPISSGALNGIDALLSTAQMPPKTPVATVAINGAVNAAYLAAQILAASDSNLAQKLLNDREAVAAQIEIDSAAIEKRL